MSSSYDYNLNKCLSKKKFEFFFLKKERNAIGFVLKTKWEHSTESQ